MSDPKVTMPPARPRSLALPLTLPLTPAAAPAGCRCSCPCRWHGPYSTAGYSMGHRPLGRPTSQRPQRAEWPV